MMGLGNRSIPPLSPTLQALLAYEQDLVPQPEIMSARAFARAREALHEQALTTFASRRSPMSLRRLVFAAAGGFVLMAGAAAAYQMLRPPPAPQAPQAESARIARPVAEPQWVPPSPAPADPPMPAPNSSASGSRAASQEELRFLLRARQADARGDYAKVLSLLAQHQHRYPVGRLAEEREVLRVKALVALGRRGQARQVAAHFHREFPRSVLLPKVDEMLISSQ